MRRNVFVEPLRREQDLVAARTIARELARRTGFDAQGQTRFATAVSEIARNALRYAKGGSVEFAIEAAVPQSLVVRVADDGPGIPHLSDVLAGRYRSTTGMGMGIVGTKRLVDECHVTTSSSGTEVVIMQSLPRTSPLLTETDCDRIGSELVTLAIADPYEELRRQNVELLTTLDELRRRQGELDELNRELEDTNRGVMALYAELEDKAESLKRASESKTSFFSNMTHEFRTPLNSVLRLTAMLLDRTDGDLTPDQELQVTYIRKSAEDLSTLVNDLLDLAKVEAGRVEVVPSAFEVSDLFGGLKGVLRPLLSTSAVALAFDLAEGLPTLHTDEGKLSQILRNLVSNALKYTERGEVRVSAAPGSDGTIIFLVRDTGIGIAPDQQERIFEEFTQLDGPLQRRAKGTGLGLPLSRKLAELLGGSVGLVSEPGVGSTFSVTIPARYGAPNGGEVGRGDDRLPPVLVVEESVATADEYRSWLVPSGYRVVEARTIADARSALAARPVAVVMDVLLGSESAWSLLAEIKERDDPPPVVVVTHVENGEKARAAGADAFALKPVAREWLVETVAALAPRKAVRRILVVDDDEVARYTLRSLLGEGAEIVDADGALSGLAAARDERPDVLFLDLAMPEMSGDDVLERLAGDEATRDIPVVVYTSEALGDERRARLLSHAVAIVNKGVASRESALAELRHALARAGLRLEAGKEARRV
jgi:signal transduction histidine kinase/DNA-binding response OmpR family regulator